MSVEYRALCGLGYYITPEMCSQLDDETYEDFVDNQYTILIDGWSDSSAYFFGIILQDADDGECKNIVNNIDDKRDEYVKMINDYHKYFVKGIFDYSAPQYYLIHQVR